MNLLASLLYLFITYVVTVHVGWSLYRSGRVFILHLMEGDEGNTDSINRMLLLGYYLLNLGYAAFLFATWEQVTTLPQLLETVGGMTGRIVITLGIIHYCNMTAIYLLAQKHHIQNIQNL
ncbi:MAG TPA: hypothetical protein VFW78_12270 [Bacteroidia bacterium]|nr:hypothetical protein [Bacteroidia bacterium]